ncbi:MAG: TolC family protein [Vicingaceae bacterium]
MKVINTLLVFAASINLGLSQDSTQTFTLEQAQAYALEHNYEYVNKEKDVLIAKRKVWETTAIGLPQVNAQADFKNFLDIPTTVVPANAFNPMAPAGELVGLKFGTDYNTTATLSVSQLVFDGSYIVGLQASKTYRDLSAIQLQKSLVEVKEDVAQAYYTVLLAEENLKILDSSLTKVMSLLDETQKIFEQGLVEEQNVDQLKLTKQNIENTLQNAKNQYQLAKNMLKFKIGYPINNPIVLVDKKEKFTKDLSFQIQDTFNPSASLDYKLALTNEHLMKLNWRKEKYSFLPSISAFFSHQQQNLSNDFEIFNSGTTWYPATLWGVTVKLPIITSGMRLAKMSQAKLDFQKAQTQTEQAEQALMLKYQSLKADLENAYKTYLNEKENLKLAEKIQRNTTLKYKEGMASSMDLTQAQNQYLTTEGRYIQSLLNVMIKQSELNKLLNSK